MLSSYEKIDGQKLYKAIKKRGLKKSQISKAVGFGESYIHDCIRRNIIRKTVIKLLQIETGIPYEEYKLEEPKQEEPKKELEKEMPEIKIDGITKQELGNLIYKAVYCAVLHAWENDKPRSEVLAKERMEQNGRITNQRI